MEIWGFEIPKSPNFQLTSPVNIKDYYSILELKPSASFDEIKKSYRRLAHLYHPDKKENDPYAAARFAEIKEAYETLTNPGKKDLYLQQRWYAQSMGRKKAEVLVTPESILKRLLELNRYLHTLDIHRMDKEGMYEYWVYILSNENIEKLIAFNETPINEEIIRLSLTHSQLVPFNSLTDFSQRLSQIDSAGQFRDQIDGIIRHRKQVQQWDQWKVWIILLIVLAFCTSIYFLTKS